MMDTVTHIAGQSIMACGRVVQPCSFCVEKLCDRKNMMAHMGPDGSAARRLSRIISSRTLVPRRCVVFAPIRAQDMGSPAQGEIIS
jgi:hypothetical protein